MLDFSSDNASGMHPAVLRALARANDGPAPAYGDDPWTARAESLLERTFGRRAEARLVLTGTGSNVLALRPFVDSYHAVYCADSSHLSRHEAGAPEAVLGATLVPVPAPDGKLSPGLLRPRVGSSGNPHESQPRAISISQPTEYGAVYAPAELAALARFAHVRGMILHVDGARLANAAAALKRPLRDAAAGADVLSFGLTKNGAMNAESVILFRPAPAFPYLRKQGLQLASKMRFPAAQFVALLEGGLALRNARHANAMARRLARGVRGVEITRPVETNAVFARLPRAAIDSLRKRFRFLVWDERTGEVRWMTSFDTRAEDVDRFAAAIRAL